MDAIEKLLSNPNASEIILYLIIALVACEFIIKLFDWFVKRFGIETKDMRHEREQSEYITKLRCEVDGIKTDQELIKKDQTEIITCLTELKNTVNDMQNKNDASERARLKDRIAQSYRYYKEKGEWSSMEKEAFHELVSSYERAGGINSFVHEICVPKSLEWRVVD